MGWLGDSYEVDAEDGYEWLCTLLNDYDCDLLEFELDAGGQNFYDDMDRILADHSQDTSPLSKFCSSHDQDTPHPRNEPQAALSESQDVLSTSISFCALLEEAQVAIELRTRSVRRPSTTPRNRLSVGVHRHQQATATPRRRAPIQIAVKPKRPSNSRKKFNRRLF